MEKTYLSKIQPFKTTNNYHQGRFIPDHPEKVLGNVNNIIYRSGWELKVMDYLDEHADVIKWGSEIVRIPYKYPIRNEIRNYYTDFYVEFKDKHGGVHRVIIEVKPFKETIPPKKPKKPNKSYGKQRLTYLINTAKWSAARQWCKKNNMEFKILTERNLGL